MTRLSGVFCLAFALATMSVVDAGAVERGGRFVYARYADSIFLDPVLNDANVDIWVLTSLYDTLLLPERNGIGQRPGLAAAWTLADDGLSLKLTLQPGVKFSDGSELTAEDVRWSLDRARRTGNGPWYMLLSSIAQIDVVSKDVLSIRLSRPDATLLPALATFNASILPKEKFLAMPGVLDIEKAKQFSVNPIGSGPFKLSSWDRGRQMTLERNQYYFRNGDDGKPLPYLDEIAFQIIPDSRVRVAKLKSGEVDGAEFIPYHEVDALRVEPAIHVQMFPSTRIRYITINTQPLLADGRVNPLADRRVRQALNYATDKTALIQESTKGLGTPMHSYMSTATPLFFDQGPAYPFDLQRARQLLQEAGFLNGLELSVVALAGNEDDDADLHAIIKTWSKIGVNLKIDSVDNDTSFQKYHAEEFQMRIDVWTDDISDPAEVTSIFAYYPNVHSSRSGYRSDDINRLFESSQISFNKEERKDMYRKIQSIYMLDAPIIFLYESPYAVGLKKSVQGFNQIPLGNVFFEDIYLKR